MAKPTTARNSTNFAARPSQLAPSNLQTSPMPERFFAKYFLKCFQGFIAALGSLVLAACGNGTAPSIDEVGDFRVINAVSDSPAITFQLEGTTVGILEFGQASNFQSIPEGNFDLDAGFSAFGQATTFLLDDEGVSVETDEQTTLVLAGTTAAPIALAIEQLNPDIATDTTEFQLLNTANAGSFDLYLTEVDGPLDTVQATVPANTASGVLLSASGVRQVRLTNEGSTTVVFDSGPFTLPSTERLLFHARPYFGPGDATVEVTVIDATSTASFPAADLPASIRIANAISDLPAVDVVIDSGGQNTELTGLTSNSFSAAIAVEPGSVVTSVTMETDPGTVFVADTSIVAGGEKRTLIAAGNFGSDTTSGRLAVDPVRSVASEAQINFMHGSVSAGAVDVYLLQGDETIDGSTAQIPGLQLLANSNLSILAGTYSLVFTPQGQATELAGPLSITVNNNILYSVLLTDADDGGVPPQITLGANFE